MAYKIEIIGSSVVITDTVANKIIVENPKRDTFFDSNVLDNEKCIQLYDTKGAKFKGYMLFDKFLLSNSQDSLGNVFTESSFRGFARQNLSSSGGESDTFMPNQQEEKLYFDSYLLPLSQKNNIQTALDTYGAIRLEKGDYSGINISVGSNNRIYGHPSSTKIGNITILSGSSNVHLEDLLFEGNELIFQSGMPITNSVFKTIKESTLKATNAKIENNTFINILSSIQFDCSASGYFRNNKIIKHQVHGTSNQLVMKGNSTTPSYGNVHLHSNFLTPAGDATDINNLQSMTFVGLDSEGWNFSGTGTKPMLYMQNMGNVKITDFGGANDYSSVQTSALNIDSSELLFINKYIKSEGSSPSSVVGARTNVLYYEGENDNYVRGDGTVTGFDLKAHYNNGTNYRDVLLNGVVQSGLISNPSSIRNSIIGNKYSPWERPVWEKIPDPTGSEWQSKRIGQNDSKNYIQGLIDSNGIAELPEGIFYIGSTLSLNVDGTKGIIGKGSAKTVIIGLTDDFPLITLVEMTEGDNNFTLANLTLQGGDKGIYSPTEIDQIAFTNLKYVVFRNQNYGIHLYWNFGLDNCFFDSVSFIDCNIGFFQDPNPDYVAIEDSGYVDKVVFYNGQFLNCTNPFSMKATRADNLNAWVNCRFDGNNLAFDISGHNFPILANCDFTNNNGQYTISGDFSIYNCLFKNNVVTKSTFLSKFTVIEGCEFLDNSVMFPDGTHYNASYYIINSKITGDVVKPYGINFALYVNSLLLSNPTLSKLLVNVKENIPTVLINETPNPYPQLLVTH